jgi:lysophospholipase L1-like esterase
MASGVLCRFVGRWGWRTAFGGVVAALAMAAPAAAQDVGPYVALGDSYTSAPFVLYPTGEPIGCGRSDHNYPHLVARAVKPSSFTDVSCGSATTDDMTGSQSVPLNGTNPPQFNALNANVSVVTIGIGGNDVGLTGIATTCAELDLTRPTGSACRDEFTTDGDEVGKRIAAAAPKIAAALQGIHARAPGARVLVIGYPDALPPDGKGCWPVVPLSPADASWFDEQMRRMNQMLAEQAAANGAEYIDVYTSSIGHDACKLPGVKWLEGLVPTAPAFPEHPNAMGEVNMARQVIGAIDPAAQIPPPKPLNLLPLDSPIPNWQVG